MHILGHHVLKQEVMEDHLRFPMRKVKHKWEQASVSISRGATNCEMHFFFDKAFLFLV